MFRPIAAVDRAAVEGVERSPPSSLSISAATASASSRSSGTARSATGPSGMSDLAGTSSRPGTSVPGRISCIAARTIVGADR